MSNAPQQNTPQQTGPKLALAVQLHIIALPPLILALLLQLDSLVIIAAMITLIATIIQIYNENIPFRLWLIFPAVISFLIVIIIIMALGWYKYPNLMQDTVHIMGAIGRDEPSPPAVAAPAPTPAPAPTRVELDGDNGPIDRFGRAFFALLATPTPGAETPPAPAQIAISPTEVPTPVVSQSNIPFRIIIPSIGVDRPVVPGDDETNKQAVIWYPSWGALPGQNGTTLIVGRKYGYIDEPNIPAPFGRLHEIKAGEEVVLITVDGKKFTYVVTSIKTDKDKKDGTPEDGVPEGKDWLVLITGAGEKEYEEGRLKGTTHFLVVVAELQP